MLALFLGVGHKKLRIIYTVKGREAGRKETENEYMYETPSCEKTQKEKVTLGCEMLDANVRYSFAQLLRSP